MNLIQAGGQLTIGGQVSARPNGHNRIEYRRSDEPTHHARQCDRPAEPRLRARAGSSRTPLPPAPPRRCAATGRASRARAVTTSNTVACDGCSAICQVEEVRQPGRIECGEECDDGPIERRSRAAPATQRATSCSLRHDDCVPSSNTVTGAWSSSRSVSAGLGLPPEHHHVHRRATRRVTPTGRAMAAGDSRWRLPERDRCPGIQECTASSVKHVNLPAPSAPPTLTRPRAVETWTPSSTSCVRSAWDGPIAD